MQLVLLVTTVVPSGVVAVHDASGVARILEAPKKIRSSAQRIEPPIPAAGDSSGI